MTVWRHLSGNSAHCKCFPPHRWCLQHRKKTRIALIIILTTIAIVFVASNHNRFMCYLEHRKYVWKDGYRLYSRTEDMIVRAVFLDDRPRYGDQSVAVFLVEMRKSIIEMNLTVECTVGGNTTDNFTIFQLSVNTWLHRDHPYLTHDFVLLECYDLPSVDNDTVANDTVAFITYMTSVSAENDLCNIHTKSVLSERPLHTSTPYKPPTDCVS